MSENDFELYPEIPGFAFGRAKYSSRHGVQKIDLEIKRKKHTCPKCGSDQVTVREEAPRAVYGLKAGVPDLYLHFTPSQVLCEACGGDWQDEPLPFLAHPKAGMTIMSEEHVMLLRNHHFDITDLANYFHVDKDIICDVESRYLKKIYPKLPDTVSAISVDEVGISDGEDSSNYLTVIRDLGGDVVLYVGEGRNQATLDGALSVLERYDIGTVYLELSEAYREWFSQHFPNAKMVYDRFHVLKMVDNAVDLEAKPISRGLNINERLKLDDERLAELADKDEATIETLERINALRHKSDPIRDLQALALALYKIYRTARNVDQTRTSLIHWCEMVEVVELERFRKYGEIIRAGLEGIMAYWECDRRTTASIEKFYDKLDLVINLAKNEGWTLELLMAKIYQLPEIKKRYLE